LWALQLEALMHFVDPYQEIRDSTVNWREFDLKMMKEIKNVTYLIYPEALHIGLNYLQDAATSIFH
jgi:hypothetical protein